MEFIIKGAVISGSLIIAIGAQNAFVLKQGLLKQSIFGVSLTCFLCDMALMTLGVLGLGSLIRANQSATLLLALLGALFLIAYSFKSFKNAFYATSFLEVETNKDEHPSRARVIASTLAITLLNPHVYLDTVVIIGGVAGTLSLDQKFQFLLGALLASCIWFFCLGYGARLLLPLFRSAKTWRILDLFIGCIMCWIALELIKYSWVTYQS